MRKKGLIFMIDVIVGMSILLIGVLVMLNYFYVNPIIDQPLSYSNDLVRFVLGTKLGELASLKITNLTKNDVIDPHDFIGEEFVKLCVERNQSFFEEMVNYTIGTIVPAHMSYSVGIVNSSYDVINVSYCLNHTTVPFEEPEIVSVSRGVLIAFNGSDTLGPYYLEVKVW